MEQYGAEELSVAVAAQAYADGKLDAGAAAEHLRVVRARGREPRAGALAAFYLGVVSGDRGHHEEAERWYRTAIGAGYVDVAAGAALNLGIALVQRGRRPEGEALLLAARDSGHAQSVAEAERCLAELRRVDEVPVRVPAEVPAPSVDQGRRWRRRRRHGPEPGDGAEALAAGWNGLAWGASTEDFRERFPQALAKDAWWVTGEGPESFCGVRMDVQYAFDPGGRLFLVALYPEVRDRERLSPAVIGALGPPSGSDLVWQVGDVAVDVKAAGVAVTLTNRTFQQ